MSLAFFGATSKSTSVTTNNTSNTTDSFNSTRSDSTVTSDTGNTSITLGGGSGFSLEALLPWVIVLAALWGAFRLLNSKG